MKKQRRNYPQSVKKRLGKSKPPVKMKPPTQKKNGGFSQQISDSVKTLMFGTKTAPTTVQESLPYRDIFRDGICRLNNGHYSKTIAFQDINYHLSHDDDKRRIFEGQCDFMNYLDYTIHYQQTFTNQRVNVEDYQQSISIKERNDGNDDDRREFSEILKTQLAKGNNGMVKTKYATVSIEAKSLKEARLRLERIETDMLNNFKTLGVKAHALNGKERLEILHGMLNPIVKNQVADKFSFNWGDIVSSGMATKDFISPTGLDFSDNRTFRMGAVYGAISFLQITAAEIGDEMLKDFLDLDTPLTVTIHVQPLNQNDAIKNIKRKLSDIDAMKIAEQKKAVRSGYDMDIMPSDLVTYGEEAKNLLTELQSRNERMFLITFLVMNTASTKRELESSISASAGVAQKYNCSLRRLDFQQEQGLMSSLPLGLNQIEIERILTTSSTAIFIPFTTQELFMGGEALYYGVNALSNNLIMANRKLLKNPNGIFLGVPGSGKSFAAKREIINVFLVTEDDIIISDPESEYFPLVERLGGQFIKLSLTSSQYINPMDVNPDYADDEDPLTLKSDFILSLCELIICNNGLEPVEKTIIDRCVRLVYRDYFADPKPENMPILQDLYELIRKQPEQEAQRIATALEIYVTGSYNAFNHRTNVDITNRLVCFDIKEMGKGLKKIAMLILQDAVWNRVTVNRAAHKTTWFYQDEIHLLLKEEQTAAYCVEIWKRFRKWGGVPTALTQNVNDFLESREVKNIFENSEFIYMLCQAAGDREVLAKHLGISEYQLGHVTNSNPGEGLMFYGNVIIPFVDRFPKESTLYKIMTTKFNELAEISKKE